MRRFSSSIKVSSAGMVVVDLMATTFVVLFLLWMVTMLRGQEEKQLTLEPPSRQPASRYNITTWTLLADEGDEHPNAEPIPESARVVNLYDDSIKFGELDEPESSWQEASPEVFMAENSAFRSFLQRAAALEPTERIRLELFENGTVYQVLDLLDEYGLDSVLSANFGDDDGDDPETDEAEAAEPTPAPISSTLEIDLTLLPAFDREQLASIVEAAPVAAALEQASLATSPMLATSPTAVDQTAAIAYLRAFLQSQDDDMLWRWLTELIYRQRGFEVTYDTHKDSLFFQVADLELINPRSTAWLRIDQLQPLLLALVVLSMFLYLLREFRGAQEGKQL